jgi:hypothetical protein
VLLVIALVSWIKYQKTGNKIEKYTNGSTLNKNFAQRERREEGRKKEKERERKKEREREERRKEGKKKRRKVGKKGTDSKATC